MDKKILIINVATQLFSERGFENTPLSAVCEKANVSKGLIFHYFKSKNDLLREIYSETTKKIIEINKLKDDALNPKEQLLQLLNNFFIQLEADKMFFQLNINMMLQPLTREILNDLIKERSSFIFDSIKKIFDQINSKNSLVLTYILIAELDGIALNYLCIFDNYPLQQIKTQILTKYA